MGSGGGGTTEQVVNSGIAGQFAPYVERVLSDVTDMYEADRLAGPSSVVADLTQEQKDALTAQKGYAQDMMAGTGLFDTAAAREADLKGILGSSMGQAATGGTLGGARQQAAMNQALADRSLEFAKDRQATALGGSDLLGDVGSVRQAYKQQLLDADDTMATRYFGYLGSQAVPQTTTTTQTGGGK
jgi:hypothetical protein